MRDIYKLRNIRSTLTQGSIINLCTSSEFPNCEVHGCIITPRCDLARDMKVSTAHYLPMVDFEDWYNRVGKERLLKNMKANATNKFDGIVKNILNQSNFSKFGLSDDLISEIIAKQTDHKKQNTLAKAFQEYRDAMSQTIDNYNPNAKERAGIVKDLLADRIPGYYPIERWDEANGTSADRMMIILLREVHSISRAIALKLTSGFIEEEFDRQELIQNGFSVSDNNSNIYQILCEMKSPYIEHIMQAFSHNFCRIGVDDMEADFHETILTKLENSK